MKRGVCSQQRNDRRRQQCRVDSPLVVIGTTASGSQPSHDIQLQSGASCAIMKWNTYVALQMTGADNTLTGNTRQMRCWHSPCRRKRRTIILPPRILLVQHIGRRDNTPFPSPCHEHDCPIGSPSYSLRCLVESLMEPTAQRERRTEALSSGETESHCPHMAVTSALDAISDANSSGL